MKRRLEPNWGTEERRRAERQRLEWDRFFAERSAAPAMTTTEDAALADVQQRHQDKLLRYPNVVGVATGIRLRGGRPTGEPSLVVLVSRKLPATKLKPAQVLPRRLEGVPVDVVEAGDLKTLRV